MGQARDWGDIPDTCISISRCDHLTLKSLSPLFSQMYTYLPITSTGANFVHTSMSYSDYGDHPWKFHPPSAQRICINPCTRHREGQHHVQTPWCPMQDLAGSHPTHPSKQILLLTPHTPWCKDAEQLGSLKCGFGFFFFFSVPLLRSPCTLSSRQPLLFVLRYHLGPSVWALPQPAPLSLSAFFSYWKPATHS